MKQPALLLGASAAVCVVMFGVPRYQGMQERIDQLERRSAAVPARERAVQADLERIEGELAQAMAALVTQDEVHQGERRQIEARIESYKSEIASLQERIVAFDESTRETTSTRIAALEGELEQSATQLRQAVDAAAKIAHSTRQDLDSIESPSEDFLWQTMVGPSVQLAGATTVGSGVLLPSTPQPGGEGYDTLVMTAWHVVRDIRADSLAEDPPIPIVIYHENGAREYTEAFLVAHEAVIDVAVLHMTSEKPVERSAYLATPEDMEAARIFRPVIAVGCPLGNDPIPTRGEVADTRHGVDGSTYWMINAPTYIGNSGGAVFDGTSYRVVGVFSKIYTHGNLRPTVVPHMGLVTPMDKVYEWLETRDELEVVISSEGATLQLTQ